MNNTKLPYFLLLNFETLGAVLIRVLISMWIPKSGALIWVPALIRGNTVIYCALNPFQSCVLFHKETSHLICSANQMTGLCMKCNTRPKMS